MLLQAHRVDRIHLESCQIESVQTPETFLSRLKRTYGARAPWSRSSSCASAAKTNAGYRETQDALPNASCKGVFQFERTWSICLYR